MTLPSKIIRSFYRMTSTIVHQKAARKPPESNPNTTKIGVVSEERLQNILSEEEGANLEILEKFEEKCPVSVDESSRITSSVIAEARKLKAETGRATYRKIHYSEGELTQSDLTEPPSPANPHPFDPSDLPPVHSHSLVPFVNHSPLLRFFVDIGVDLSEIENTNPNIGRHILRLQMEDVLPKIELLQKEIGFENEAIGTYLTRNPFFLLQDVADMQTRLNYLEMKKFSKEERRKIVDGYRYWLNCNVQLIDSRLGWLQKQFGLTAKLTRQVIVKEPRIIMFGTGPLERLVQMFTKELSFSSEQLKKLVVDDPRLFMMDSKLISKTYKYVRDVMRINNETIVEHPLILRCSFSAIKSRHDFLQRLGRAHYQLSGKKEGKYDVSDVADAKYPIGKVELVDLEHFLHPTDAGFAMMAAKTYTVAYDRFLRNS
uniref:Transcription termination factor 3, mitochondrial n=2 Tax=Caenorhabditis japonica TaxID=281687 RepID=A0A8R1E1A0_CAEJA